MVSITDRHKRSFGILCLHIPDGIFCSKLSLKVLLVAELLEICQPHKNECVYVSVVIY